MSHCSSSHLLVGLLIPASLAAIGGGCAPALREPPPVGELTRRPATGQPTDTDASLARAEEHFARRTIEGVRQAADSWLEAAGADPETVESWIGATRAHVWLADHLEEREARRSEATAAVHAAQWCDQVSPDNAACLYWLAVAVGIQGRERKSTGLDAAPQMLKLLQRALAIEPEIEQAGPHRVLALVYLRAPGWPAGPGDPDLGLEHASKAVELRPDYPPNVLALAEARAATEDREGSRRSYRRALELARRWAGEGDPDAHEWVEQAEKALGAR